MAAVCDTGYFGYAKYLSPTSQADFRIYYVASQLVRAHDDADLYDGIGSDAFYGRGSMDQGTAFAQMARRYGIPHVLFYNYPPLLADLLLPVTSLSVTQAEWAWRIVSLAAVFLGSACITLLLGYPPFSLRGLAVLAGILCIAPFYSGLHFGQITAVLFLLWCAGILFYVRGTPSASALMLALAVLLKMTPLLVVVPILIWRDWRWLRWFTVWMLLGVLCMGWINSPALLLSYVRDTVPRMSIGVADIDNKTVSSMIGILWGIKGRITSHTVILLGRALSALLILAAAALTFRTRKDSAPQRQACVLAAFALLSICVTPIAWLDNYILGGILLALLWGRVLVAGTSTVRLVLLFAATISIGTASEPSFLYWRLDHWMAFQMAPVILALALIFFALSGQSSSGDDTEQAEEKVFGLQSLGGASA